MIEAFIVALRRINAAIGLAVGAVLLVAVALVLLEILLREIEISLGGAEEISGYVMAIVASWGLSVALTEMAHVRIDIIRARLRQPFQAIMDLGAMLALAGTAILVARQAWPVLEKTLQRNSLANTPLETPLWIPQTLWLAGWVWFAIVSSLLVICAALLLLRGRTERLGVFVGTSCELDYDQ